MTEFVAYQKIPRWSKDIVITEKIDGTNASIFVGQDGEFLVGSRNRWITPEADNFGFAAWAYENEESLRWLGPGHHYGEWWGPGIQRGYGTNRKRFSLFNARRWSEQRPPCCDVVPILYSGPNVQGVVEAVLGELGRSGSAAAPGFMNPEGIVIFHVAGQNLYKKTLGSDGAKGDPT